MGRPPEFDRQFVVDVAMEMFWCKGYEATSMADLLSAMKLSKSSFYQAFGSQRNLFDLCLTRYATLLSANLEKELDRAPSGRYFLEQLLRSVASTAGHPEGVKGCLMVNSINELGQSDSGLSLTVEKGLQTFTDIFLRAIRRAQAAGEISNSADPFVLAHFLHIGISGLRTMIKAGVDRATVDGAVTLLLCTLV